MTLVRARLQATATTISLLVLPLVFALLLGPSLADRGAPPASVVLTMSAAEGPGPSVALSGSGGLTRLAFALGVSLVLSAGLWLTVSAARRID